MGFFDRFLGRNKSAESNDSAAPQEKFDGINVSFKIFQKFQEDTRQGMQSMRGEFNKLVEENHLLKKQVMAVTDRLDEIHREQLKQGVETRSGLNNLSKSIVEMGGKVKPSSTSSQLTGSFPEFSGNDDKKAKDAQSALEFLNTPNGRSSAVSDAAKRKPG